MNRPSQSNQGHTTCRTYNVIVIHYSVQSLMFIDSVKSMLCSKMMFDLHIVYFQSYLVLTTTKK